MRKQMKDYLVDSGGRIAVRHILRQENLEEDLERFIRKLDLKVKVAKRRVNVARREADYRMYYSDQEAEIIARRHAEDLALFDYRF